jgi:phenylalanyl-tRNA synthetase alpha chain
MIAWAGWGLVITRFDPFQIGFLGFSIFYLSTFLALGGLFFILASLFFRKFSSQPLTFFKVKASVRHAVQFSILITGWAFLQGNSLLRWWNLLLLIAILTVMEFLFISLEREKKHIPMKEKISQLREQFSREIRDLSTPESLAELEIKYLGRKAGELNAILRGLKDLSPEEKREVGALANDLRKEMEEKIKEAGISLNNSGAASGDFDPTLPGMKFPEGHLHLVTQAIAEISEIFEHLGFVRRRYPEVEWDWYAFESLNMPPDHPARDEWETFFIDKTPVNKLGQRILTPHSTSGDVREMEKGQLPIRMINISKTFRRQIDISHIPMFHQFDGLLIDKNVTIADLKGTLDYFAKQFFGQDRKARIRPHHFQFTEPSFEVDISCGLCHGTGQRETGEPCRVCKSGWLELGGSGMIHQNVLKAGKIDPKKYSGFAFGWGVERCYMMKSGLAIPDIRMLYQNDLRFLQQF